MFVNCLLKVFALSMLMIAVLVPKQMLLSSCAGGFLLNSFAIPQGVWIVFVINFVKMLFPGVCFVFMYLFVYVILKSNDLWV